MWPHVAVSDPESESVDEIQGEPCSLGSRSEKWWLKERMSHPFFQVSLQVLSRSLALSSFIYFDKVQTNEVHPASHWKMKEGGQGEMEPTERKFAEFRERAGCGFLF